MPENRLIRGKLGAGSLSQCFRHEDDNCINGVRPDDLKGGVEEGEARQGDGFRELFAEGVAWPAEELDGAQGGHCGGQEEGGDGPSGLLGTAYRNHFIWSRSGTLMSCSCRPSAAARCRNG